jgi:hypothetical protein
MIHSVLAHATPEMVVHDPFPYVVIDNALDEELYTALEREYPFEYRIDGYSGFANNARYQVSAVDGLRGDRLTPLWKEFVAYHTSPAFLQDVFRVFGDDLKNRYPTLTSKMQTGVRFRDQSANVWLDCQPGINSPVTSMTSVKGPHIDHPNEIYASLLYFRHPEDTATGSELDIYRTVGAPQFYGARFIDKSRVEKVATVSYARNRLIFFINTVGSVHGVAPRGLTRYTRRLVNIIGEVDGAPLFTVPTDQSVLAKARRLVRTLISR